MTHAFLQGLKAPLHISHRGGALLSPENTMRAFSDAVDRWETDVLELDLHLTRDGEMVVAHDDTVDRCTDGHGTIASMSFAELQQLDAAAHFPRLRGTAIRIPRFAEVLARFPTVRLNVELKVGAVIDAFIKLPASELHRMCIGSENDEVAAALHAKLPDQCHFFPANAGAAFVLGGDDDDRYTVLDLPYQWADQWVFTEALRDRAKSLGKWVNFWTVNEEADMRRLVKEGAGGVMTDRPDLLRAVLDESR